MSVYMIGTMKNGKEVTNIRLLDTVAQRTMDVEVRRVATAISGGVIKIENLCVENGKVAGVNGDIDRYGVIGVSQSCTVLGIIKSGDTTVGYKVSDCDGRIRKLPTEDILKLSKTISIANGKVVKKDGTKFISAIKGEYPLIEGESIEKPVDKKKRTKQETVLAIKNGIIVNEKTGKQVGKQGNVEFREIIYQLPGKVVILTTWETRSRIIKYDIESNRFEQVLNGMQYIQVIELGSIVLFRSTATENYGRVWTSIGVLNKKTKVMSSNIFTEERPSSKQFKELSVSDDCTVIYQDLIPENGSHAHLNRVTIYKVYGEDVRINVLCDVILGGENEKLKRVKFLGNQAEQVNMCMTVGNHIAVCIDKKAVILTKYGIRELGKLTDEYTEYLGLTDNNGIILSNGSQKKVIHVQRKDNSESIIVEDLK